MMLLRLALAVILSLSLAACAYRGAGNLGYDPAKNPVVELERAKQEAARGTKRVMIIAGGDWCGWCHRLDQLLTENEDAKSELDRRFVVVKVYFGDENSNEEFFKSLPAASGYPHFWVLGKDGTAHSIGAGPLAQGNHYDKSRFVEMLRSASQL